MKKPGNKSEFTGARDRELHAAFMRLLAESRLPLGELFGLAAEQPCSRSWTSAERTQVVLSRMRRGLPLGPMYKLRLEMYEHLRRVVDGLRAADPSMPEIHACELAVLMPAPKFYITPKQARAIITRVRKEIKKEKEERRKEERPWKKLVLKR